MRTSTPINSFYCRFNNLKEIGKTLHIFAIYGLYVPMRYTTAKIIATSMAKEIKIVSRKYSSNFRLVKPENWCSETNIITSASKSTALARLENGITEPIIV